MFIIIQSVEYNESEICKQDFTGREPALILQMCHARHKRSLDLYASM